MTLTARFIANALGFESNDDTQITIILTDSRDLNFPVETMFVALRTPGNDGHKFIPELYEKGVRYFVVDSPIDSFLYPGATFLKVENTLDALQEIASHARSLFNKPVIGITGSCGKTVVKEMIFKMLRKSGLKVSRSPRSYNSQIGVPLSICEIEPDADVAIIEAGISQPGEMARLERMIRPTYGILTNVTDEHSQGFESIEQKVMEKAILFKDCMIVLIPNGDDIIWKCVKKQAPYAAIVNVDNPSDSPKDMMLRLAKAGAQLISKDARAERDEVSQPASARIDVRETLKNCVLVTDGFTNDLRSIADALNFARRHVTPQRSLAAVIEYPIDDDAMVESMLPRLLKANNVVRLVGIGFPKGWEKRLDIPAEFVESVPSFLQRYTISDFKSSQVILIKGDAADGFEDITALLETPRHETVMEVNLSAITNNFNYYRSLLPSSSGIVAMVKAAGYGVGALELAKTLQNQGAAYLAVAVIDEGAELRRAGISLPIIVMNPIGTYHKALFDNKLEPSVFSIRELQQLLEQAKRLGITDYPIHIKLDTGMHRVGFLEEELPQLLEILKNQNEVKVASIFSHLATADCLDQDEYTEAQLSAFEAMSSTIMRSLPYKPLRHILNTAGIMRYPAHHYDMARLGIGLYGISPVPQEIEHLATVARLTTTIISIKHWDKGATIGYGRKGKVTQPSIIATIPIGYADGLDRHLSNGKACFIVNGKECPTIGNICMDQCMIDVTGADAKIGDKVEIFGPNAPITRLSDTLGTIPYEILTSISPRVKRIYFKD